MDLPVPRYKPMLASAGAIRGDADDYCFEPKLDGWRATVTVVAGELRVSTRSGRDVTESLPELAPIASAFVGKSAVLDGELVAFAGDPSSFYRLGGRMAARRPASVAAARARTPATFVAFDLLWCDGDLTRQTYLERRERLEGLALRGPAWCTVSSFRGLGAELFAACTVLKLEGLVAKRCDSPYEPGVRSKHWVKAKCSSWFDSHAAYRRPR